MLDAPGAPAGLDCRPFKPGVDVDAIRELLDVAAVWDDGHRGEGIVVGIIDEGINGATYPVIGGFSRPGRQAPGAAQITSHGSMCAADVLVAAPDAKLYDYPFLGIPNSGGALAMFQAVLDQRRVDGTPHVTSNSYGFVGVPPREQFPTHEIWDLDHPLHRKVREVIASGAPTFFAAGNCGENCPSGKCQPTGIGPGHSIHASNSLVEVITIAAVNSRHERIGYSSQGPGMFEREKPDLSALLPPLRQLRAGQAGRGHRAVRQRDLRGHARRRRRRRPARVCAGRRDAGSAALRPRRGRDERRLRLERRLRPGRHQRRGGVRRAQAPARGRLDVDRVMKWLLTVPAGVDLVDLRRALAEHGVAVDVESCIPLADGRAGRRGRGPGRAAGHARAHAGHGRVKASPSSDLELYDAVEGDE